jgi:uncharacterized protein YndB with AHSA1/START domain
VNEPTPDPPGPMTATISLGADFDHPTSTVWTAFADIDQRVRWGVPEGEEMICDVDEFRPGGSIRARCGTPGALEYDSAGQYCAVEPERWLVTTETLTREGQVLSTAIITWTFEATSSGTRVDLVDQVVSFVGQGMIDGHRNGHEICLRQLGEHLTA